MDPRRESDSLPVVSVVMPCFNAAEHLAAAAGSVLAQTYPNVELVVVDDGSTDASPEILAGLAAQYPERVRTFQQPNKGPYPARNLGLSRAKGELIAFLDADDYWETEFLERMYGALSKGAAQIAYCGWQNVGKGGQGDAPYVPPDYGAGDPVAAFLQDCPWPIHAALLRRSLAERVGGFSERYFSSLDYDFWLRILTVTHEMVRVPEVMAYYRWHGAGQISANRSRQAIEAWRVRRDFVQDHPDQVEHLDREIIDAYVQGPLRSAALDAFWRRDLPNAQALLRKALRVGALTLSDLKYAVPAYLPPPLFRRLALALEKKTAGDTSPG